MMQLKHLAAAIAAAALLSLSGVSAASAADAVVLNGTGVRGGGTTRAAVFIMGTSQLSCSTTTTSADLAGDSAGYPITIGRNLSLGFIGCTAAGTPYALSCTRTGQVDVALGSVLDDTPITWDNLSCSVNLGTRLTCTTITGSVVGTYSNLTQRVRLDTLGRLTTGASARVCSGIPANTATSLVANATGPVQLVYQWPANLRMLSS